jgi:hypothetical protein
MNRFIDQTTIYPRKLDRISAAFVRMSEVTIRIELENENKIFNGIGEGEKALEAIGS